MPLPYGQIPDAQNKDNTYSFRLGHVERVFTSMEDQIVLDSIVQSQMINIKPIGHVPTKRKPILRAIPLLRGVSDSITRGDIVLYTFIGDNYFYLGPINTLNIPSRSPDMLYSTTYDMTFGDKDSGFNSLNFYGDEFCETILEALHPKMEEFTGLELLPEYGYLRLYQKVQYQEYLKSLQVQDNHYH